MAPRTAKIIGLVSDNLVSCKKIATAMLKVSLKLKMLYGQPVKIKIFLNSPVMRH